MIGPNFTRKIFGSLLTLSGGLIAGLPAGGFVGGMLVGFLTAPYELRMHNFEQRLNFQRSESFAGRVAQDFFWLTRHIGKSTVDGTVAGFKTAADVVVYHIDKISKSYYQGRFLAEKNDKDNNQKSK